MLIRHLVKQKEDAAFANDVQLAWYPDDKRNLPLVRGYMFADKATQGRVSSVEVLERLYRSYLHGEENRFVLMATYGHGKSHFALALANFFGRAANSPELQALLTNLEHTVGPAKAQNYRDFRLGRPPFLVVRLRGDQAQGLQQQFLRGLEQALAEHPATADLRLPFWFEPAERFLCALTDPALASANRVLGPKLDVGQLIQHVRDRRPEAYDFCVRVFREVHGFLPDFGGEISLQQVLQWVVETCCSGQRPKTSGILILLDEFSAFIKRYGQSRTAVSTTSLQDLLNGVADHPRRAAFLALSQHDPSTVARNVLKNHPEDVIDDLEIQLSRLPQSHRYQLYSSMETVLDAYLAQEEGLQDALNAANNAISDANDDTVQLFGQRYEPAQGWGLERFNEVVTYGCFPLHPLTTALFCSVSFAETQNERSVLNFVLTELERKLDEPAVLGDRPNWIYPVSLVEWFGNMLGESEFQEYETARRRIGGDITPDELAVLKGVLLFHVGQLRRSNFGFDRIVSHMTGIEGARSRSILEDLTSRHLLRYDDSRKTYGFWSSATDPHRLVEAINRELPRKTLDLQTLSKLNEDWSKTTSKRLRVQEVSIGERGHPQDWTYSEFLLTKEHFTRDQILQIAQGFRLDQQGLKDGRRGCLIRLVAANQAEVDFFAAHAEQVLDSALGEDPIPCVLALPHAAHPVLLNSIKKELILQGLPQIRKSDLGIEACQELQRRTAQQISEQLVVLRNSAEYIAPHSYRAAIRSRGWQENEKQTLEACYRLAYESGPRTFVTHLKADNPNLRKAVLLIARYLVTDRVGANLSVIEENPVAKDIVSKFLRVGGQLSWGILTDTLRINPKDCRGVGSGWTLLDQIFAPGSSSVPLQNALLTLLNPPFGYGYNELLLLFCAWYGFHSREVQLTSGSNPLSLIETIVSRDRPREVIAQLLHVDQARLSRRDTAHETQGVQLLIERCRKGNISRQDAAAAISKLGGFSSDERSEREVRQDASATARDLGIDLETAENYHKAVSAIQATLHATPKLDALIGLYEKLKNLPTLGLVRDDGWPSVAELGESLNSTLSQHVSVECGRLETLTKIADYSLNETRLKQIRRVIKPLGSQDLVARIDAAMVCLAQRFEELNSRQRDDELRAELRLMSVDHRLTEIREYAAKLSAYGHASEKTAALIEKTQQQMTDAIQRRIQWIDDVRSRLESAVTLKDCSLLQQEMNRAYRIYEGSPEQVGLIALLERCGRLCSVFQRLEESRARSFSNPLAASEEIATLDRLAAESAVDLRDGHRKEIAKAQERVRQDVAAQEDRASQWLSHRERELESGREIEKLRSALDRPPAFLPEALHDRLSLLRRRVDERLRERSRAEEIRRQQEALRAQIRALSDRVPLQQLRESLRSLGELVSEDEGTLVAISEKRTALQRAVQSRLDSLIRWEGQLQRVSSIGEAESIQRELELGSQFFEGSPEEDQLASLVELCHARAEALKKQAAALQRERELQQKIKSLSEQGTLTSIRSRLLSLNELRSEDPETHRIWEAKQLALEAAEQQVLNRVLIWRRESSEVHTPEMARKLQGEIQRHLHLFSDTPEQTAVEALATGCGRLEAGFNQLRQLASEKLQAPADVDRIQESIQVLRSDLAGSLSECQSAQFDRALSDVRASATTASGHALRWLEKCEQDEASASDLPNLADRLQRPPAFLAPDEFPRLGRLRTRVQDRIDADVVRSIEVQFRRIKEPQRRAECLLLLQKVAQEIQLA